MDICYHQQNILKYLILKQWKHGVVLLGPSEKDKDEAKSLFQPKAF